jgi:hypothetical protein
VSALRTVAGGRDLEECLTETGLEMQRLEIEIAWCRQMLGEADHTAVMPG